MADFGEKTPPSLPRARVVDSSAGKSGSSNDGNRELVVQHVKEAGVTVRYPVLTSTNYIE